MSCKNLPFQWVTLIFSTFNLQNNVKNDQESCVKYQKYWQNQHYWIIKTIKSESCLSYWNCSQTFFSCIDSTFFTGSKCETPISECCNYGSSAPNSCLNGGTCDDSTTGSPQCICDSCFTDEFCSTCECRYIFSQGYSLYFFFSFLLIYGC